MKTKIASVVLVCVMMLTMELGIITVSAEETTGYCGENVQWSYNSETGELIITGTGGTDDYNRYPEFNEIPWANYCDNIKSISVSDGITYVGHSAFANCKNVTNVQMPKSGINLGDSVFSGCKSLKTVNLPETLEEIPPHIFWGCEALETVEIPDTVTKIGNGAFGCCYGLCEIKIPANLEQIGDSAFQRCYELQNIDIPDSVSEIGGSAFWKCSTLQSIKLPNKLVSLKESIFYDCSDLETVYMGDYISEIGYNAFYGCSKLNNIIVSENNKIYSSDEHGVLFNKDKTKLLFFPNGKTGSYTSPESVTSIQSGAFSYADVESVTINGELEVVDDETFNCCSYLKELILPDSVKMIKDEAMFGCNALETFDIPDSVESIGAQAFYGCDNLEEIDISEKVIFIGERAFDMCYNMKAINVDEKNAYFSSDNGILYNKTKTELIKVPTFYEQKSYEIVNTTGTIKSYAFNECVILEEITIPLSVKIFENYAFEDIGEIRDIYYLGTPEQWSAIDKGIENDVLEYKTIRYITDDIRSGKTASSNWEVNLYDGKFEVGIDDMDDYSIASPAPWYEFADQINTISSYCFEIGDYAFYGCENATKATISPAFGVFKSIGKSAFENCKNITEITIPSDVTVINERTFAGCENLKTVTIKGEITSVAENAFYGCDSLERVILSQTEEEWEVLSPTIGSGNEAFENALDFYVDPRELSGQCGDNLYWEFDKEISELKITGDGEMYDFTLPQDVPWEKWSGDVKGISLPNGLTEISRNAFWGFTEITTCEIPVNVTEIGSDAFYYCKKLEKIEIPSGVKVVRNECFSRCEALKEVTLPDTVETIESGAFEKCIRLKEISIPNVTEIGSAAFSGCNSFVRFDVPENVITIGNSILAQCNNLEYVTIPKSVTNIGDTPFDQSRKLKSITVDENNANYCSMNGVLYSKDKTVLICHPGGKNGLFKIPNTVKILRKCCFDGYFESSIEIPESVIDIEVSAFPFSTFSDIYYGGSEEQWDAITIENVNDCLNKEIVHFNMSNIWPYTKTEITTVESGTEFTVSTDSVPQNSRVLLACYKNGMLVEFKHKVCTADEVSFTSDKDFDYVKVLVWESVGENTPICGAEEIYNQ